MPYTTMRGPALSKSKLADAVKAIRPSDKETATRCYWEYVPQDKDYTADEQAAFIICAMPSVARFPAKVIADLVTAEIRKRAMCDVKPKDHPFALPNLAKRALAENPELSQKCIGVARRQKHVPDHIKSNDMWALQVAISMAIGTAANGQGYPTESSPECEPMLTDNELYDVMDKWVSVNAMF